MYFSNAVIALGFAALAHAAQNFTITVGMNKTNTFTPSFVNATTGDTLIFEFVAGNHTLTQSTFHAPCVNAKGVDSGFKPVGNNGGMPMTFEYTLTNDSTMWFYCEQGTHCQQGMVFALNPTATESFAMFQGNAMMSNTTSTGSMSMTAPSASATTMKNGAGMVGASVAGVVGSVGLAWALL